MTESTRKQFKAALNDDEGFRNALLTAGSFERAASLANQRNLAVTVEDLKALAGHPPAPPEGALSDADLATVAGGKITERYDQSAKNVIQSMRG